MDYLEEHGIRKPIFRKSPHAQNFSYPTALLSKACDFYEIHNRVPTYNEVLYWHGDWENQVLLWHEGRQWAANALDKSD